MNKEDYNIHPQMIDLGLPSGTLWASCNVGATKPEEYGGYYAWGETDEKRNYNDVTYKYSDGEDVDGSGWYEGTIKWQDLGHNISGTKYDVAHVRMGGDWQMPTIEQVKELLDNCECEWTEVNGVRGIKLTGQNGNSIFIPAAGSKYGSKYSHIGEEGRYWLGTEDSSDHFYNACSLVFRTWNTGWDYYCPRVDGQSIRAVAKK